MHVKDRGFYISTSIYWYVFKIESKVDSELTVYAGQQIGSEERCIIASDYNKLMNVVYLYETDDGEKLERDCFLKR